MSQFWINLKFAFHIIAPALFFLHETVRNHSFNCMGFSNGEIDCFKEQINLHTLNSIKSEKQYLSSNTMENWFEHYKKCLNTTNSTYFLNTTSMYKEILYDFKLTNIITQDFIPL